MVKTLIKQWLVQHLENKGFYLLESVSPRFTFSNGKGVLVSVIIEEPYKEQDYYRITLQQPKTVIRNCDSIVEISEESDDYYMPIKTSETMLEIDEKLKFLADLAYSRV